MYYFYYKDDDSKYLSQGRCGIGIDSCVRIEWCIPSKLIGIGIRIENDIQFYVSLFVFSIWIKFNIKPISKILAYLTSRKGEKYPCKRKIGLDFHSGSLWLSIWRNEMESRSDDYFFQSFKIDFERLLKGNCKYSTEIIDARDILIPMPEKSYMSKAIKLIRIYEYSRWFTNKITCVDIEVEGGIPFEGKGENSYDCGVDRFFSFSCSAKSIPEAVGKFVGSVLKDRVKNGGWNDYVWNK